MKLWSAVLTLFIAVFLISGCTALDKSSDKIAASEEPDNATTKGDNSTNAESLKEFTIHGGGELGMAFDTKEIKISEGDKVKITFVNDGGFHNLMVDGYNVGTEQKSGPNTQTFTFTADKTGEFAFYCSVSNHRAMGLEGKIIVE